MEFFGKGFRSWQAVHQGIDYILVKEHQVTAISLQAAAYWMWTISVLLRLWRVPHCSAEPLFYSLPLPISF
jgi:hypothetical protein